MDSAPRVVAELAANAALHGRVPGRDFRLTLTVHSRTLRIDVADARGDRLPVCPRAACEGPAESGYGLLLVEELADRWGVDAGRVSSKAVWAELGLDALR
ncbi:ATP-binding protein [Streptomyces platensis]|uniref:ATP-binding protein n=1 Tax=Streptomyces platensis TaxID=58346 RepID=UPI00378A89DC